MKKTLAFLVLAAVALPGLAQDGQIKICRRPGIVGLMDGKTVQIPADTYTGSCNRNGENCRAITVAGQAATLGPTKSACVTIKAKLVRGDDKPLKAGEELLTQWSIPGFEPIVRVVSGFK